MLFISAKWIALRSIIFFVKQNLSCTNVILLSNIINSHVEHCKLTSRST